ncbi:translation initiation factor eIF-2B subunit gamma isoform X2 [Lingula anatina]|nr:translation initiation factor eIF-2B subunit gamma isoform X2 [Lingula anatina]|eukprot:XP_013410892.1 translation initiation factor eIF-2B subunit gamma isoform X2 [Lingula anatina]
MAEFQAVIMAGGKGSRMTDLTAKIPKALLPIGNLPMVWYPINLLERSGFEDAIIIVPAYFKAEIERALQMCEVKLNLDFVEVPDDEDWGTCDSLRHIKDKITTDLLIISCDLIVDFPLNALADVHRTYDATVTTLMSVAPETFTELTAPGTKSKRKMEHDFVGLDEKGNRLLFLGSDADFEETVTFKKSLLKRHPCINIRTKLLDGHLYLMKKWVLDYLAEQSSLTTLKGELVPYLVRKQFSQAAKVPEKDLPNANASVISVATVKDIYGFAVEDNMAGITREYSSWNDHSGDMEGCYHGNKIRCYTHILNEGFLLRANTVATYCEANRQIAKLLASLRPSKDVKPVHPTATVAQKAQVGNDSLVGEGVTIGEKTSIKKSVIGKHCSIGEKVKITNSVIMDHVTIKEG